VSFINKFEDTVCGIAAEQGYKYVICGHIHQPEISHRVTPDGPVVYMNSGDWIENLSSLEYHDGRWQIYRYSEDPVAQAVDVNTKKKHAENPKSMMELLIKELHLNDHAATKSNDLGETIPA